MRFEQEIFGGEKVPWDRLGGAAIDIRFQKPIGSLRLAKKSGPVDNQNFFR